VAQIKSEEQPVGARERNKERTREVLEQTALDLFTARGFDDVSVDEIVAAAGVSKRTFYRYYDAKEDLLIASHLRMFDRWLLALRKRPARERLLEAVRRAVMAARDEDAADELFLRDQVRVLIETPTLARRLSATYMQIENTLAELVADRLGVHESDLEPHMLAAAILSMMRVVMVEWMDTGAEGSLADRIAAHFRKVGRITPGI
jgi:AcrR family transcriptional regulator